MKRLIRSKRTGGLVNKSDDVLLSDTSDVQYLSVGDITVASYVNKLDTQGIVLDENQCTEMKVSLDDVIDTGRLVGFMAGDGPPQGDEQSQSVQCHAGVVYMDATNGHIYQRASDGSWFKVAGETGYRYNFIIYYNNKILHYLGGAYTVRISHHDIEFKRVYSSGSSVSASKIYGNYAKGALVLDGSGIFDFIKPSQPSSVMNVNYQEPHDTQFYDGDELYRDVFTGYTSTETTSTTSNGAHATYYYSVSWKRIEDKYNAFIKSVMRSVLKRHLVFGKKELLAIFNVYYVVETNDVIETIHTVRSAANQKIYHWDAEKERWNLIINYIWNAVDKTITSKTSIGSTVGYRKAITSLADLTFSEGSKSDSPYVVSSCEYKKSQSDDISDYGMDDYKITLH